MSKPTTGGGLTNIREAVAARVFVMATIARDCGVSTDLLELFRRAAQTFRRRSRSSGEFVWNGFIEDKAEADGLQPVQQPIPRSLVALPKLEMTLPVYTAGPAQQGGPQPEFQPEKPKQRAGWIGGVWE